MDCKQYTHLARLRTRNFFSCAWLKGPTRLKCLDCSISVRVILKQSSYSSHATFNALLDPPFTAPIQSTSTSSSLLFPSNWTPYAAPLFGQFAEPSPLTGYEPNAPIEASSEATPMVLDSRRCSLESTCDDFATTLDAFEAGDRSDVGRLPSSLLQQERKTSANPFGASFSHSRSSVEKSKARNHNKRKSSQDLGIAHGSQLEREKILSEQRSS